MTFWGCKVARELWSVLRGAAARVAASSTLTTVPFHSLDEDLLSNEDINVRNVFSNLLRLFPLRNIDFSLHSAWDGAE